jgi:hypothetical protein
MKCEIYLSEGLKNAVVPLKAKSFIADNFQCETNSTTRGSIICIAGDPSGSSCVVSSVS